MNTLTSDHVDWELSAAMALLLWPAHIKHAVEYLRAQSETEAVYYREFLPVKGSGSLLYDETIAPRLGLPATRAALLRLLDAALEMVNAHDQEEAASRAA